MESWFVGYDPAAIAERADAAVAQRRLDELGDEHSTGALVEKTDLLRIVGRIDEANDAATDAIRQARLANDRESLLRAKTARALLLVTSGLPEQAVHELSDTINEAGSAGRDDLVDAARRRRGLAYAAIGDYRAAHEDFNETLVALVRAGAAPLEIDTVMVVVGALLDRIVGAPAGAGRAAAPAVP